LILTSDEDKKNHVILFGKIKVLPKKKRGCFILKDVSFGDMINFGKFK